MIVKTQDYFISGIRRPRTGFESDNYYHLVVHSNKSLFRC
jgi:hypothetical protein